jgi:hypothetical protein
VGTLSEDEQQAIYADYGALNQTPRRHPGPPARAARECTRCACRTARRRPARDPSSERAAVAVGGYFIFEADDLDAAIELAARIPAARLGGAIEVRPVGTYW